MQFMYTVQNEQGLHVQPATVLAKEAVKYKSAMTIATTQKSADLKKVFGIVGLGVKCGDSFVIDVQGEDEERAVMALKTLIEKIL